MTLAEKILTAPELVDPWPHGIIDQFLPLEPFAELVGSLPSWTTGQKTKNLPTSVLELLNDSAVNDAIRQRFGFTGGKPVIELTYRTLGVGGHSDRVDKLWSGIIYVAGDPVGTELYGKDYRLAKTVEFKPNRMLCWGRRGEQHAVPKSNGRFAIQWWILK